MRLVLFAATIVVSAQAAAAECMQANIPGGIAEGTLSRGDFEDAAGRPEQAFILALPTPTCLTGPDEMDNIEEAETLHIYSSDEGVLASIGKFMGKDVQVRGTPFGAHTAHHHAPIVMDVSAIDAL
jgi:hypothetical protein